MKERKVKNRLPVLCDLCGETIHAGEDCIVAFDVEAGRALFKHIVCPGAAAVALEEVRPPPKIPARRSPIGSNLENARTWGESKNFLEKVSFPRPKPRSLLQKLLSFSPLASQAEGMQKGLGRVGGGEGNGLSSKGLLFPAAIFPESF